MAATQPAPSARWLQGPVSDVVLGGGLLYVPVLLLLFAAGPDPGEALPFFAVPILLLVCMNAHLGATLLRVYERPEDRRRYWFFTFWVTIVIALAGVTSLFVAPVGSVLITFYLTIVPWHFTAQNYGVALVLLRRQGVEITPASKRSIQAAFVLPFVLWILALHGARPGAVEYAPLTTGGTHFQFLSAGIPGSVQGPAVILGLLAYLWFLGDCCLQLRGRARVRELLPAATLFFSQGLWFAAPVLAAILLEPGQMGPFAPGQAAFTFVWISIMHCVQYLWITAYYAKRDRPGQATPRFLVKALFAGTALYGIPALMLAPVVAGRLTYGSGLGLMLSTALSIHHIVLDGAIWKLRDNRIARILIGGVEDRLPSTSSRRHWLKPLALASGALGIVFAVVETVESEVGVDRAAARGDVERLQTAVRRLAWIGREDHRSRAELGFLLGERGDDEAAIREFERSIEITPSVLAWTNLGALRERQGRLRAALEAYDEALAIDPDDVAALHYAGRTSRKAGRPERARQLLERALALAPERVDIRDELAKAAPG